MQSNDSNIVSVLMAAEAASKQMNNAKAIILLFDEGFDADTRLLQKV